MSKASRKIRFRNNLAVSIAVMVLIFGGLIIANSILAGTISESTEKMINGASVLVGLAAVTIIWIQK